MPPDASRMPLVDALKAFACLSIVLHHLAFYGPMTDIAAPLMPGLIAWFNDYGRMAVQVFLVVSGFLFGARYLGKEAHARQTIQPMAALLQRYTRLVVPYSAALLLAIACNGLASLGMEHRSLSAPPAPGQLLAHVLLLHNLLDEEALSAGVWYVAIDFQLFTLATLLIWLPGRIAPLRAHARPLALALLGIMTGASLFGFNRDAWWDESAFYFFGAFGLGILAWWAAGQRHAQLWLLGLTLLALSALVLDFRLRLAIALGVMLILGLGRHTGLLHRLPIPKPLTGLSRISYSVFLVHFPLCLLVNAVFVSLFPSSPTLNAFGIMLAILLSLLGGWAFHRRVECRAYGLRTRLLFPAGLVASGWLGSLMISGLAG
ncbi:acyltransferase [Zoogloea sp.]|uniref:acyltransferase family protein n=1 Tax=Zoogloea sp. TaxID=49181 RepID=UPI00262160A8|nr:acyltransferase [Zoogloea sp.]MDD3352265.1 acyltransferase [Zoogloea sp.]